MAITSKDIADKLNISRSTVSRVLNNKGMDFISEATRKRVLEAAKEMGYHANPAARALVTGRTNMIAFWSPNLSTPFFTQVMNRLSRLARESKYEIIMSEFGAQTAWTSDMVHFSSWPVDGVIVYGSHGYLRSTIEYQSSINVPMVDIGSKDHELTDFINIDLYSSALEAVRLMISSGRSRVAHMLSPGTNKAGESRFDAYTTAMQEAGRVPEYILTADHLRSSARSAMIEYVGANGCPDGLFCANDDIAIGAYRGLCDLGIKVPDDVALVGCDGIEDTEYLEVPISTIVQPVEEMGAIAWQFVQNRMKDQSIPRQYANLKSHLLIRESL